MKASNTKVDYTKIYGGMDITSPSLSVASGKASFAINYEPGDTGGLRRIDGYERFDGSPSPSDAVYYFCETVLTDTVSVGDTITGVDTGATGYVIVVDTGELAFTKASLTFDADEAITVGGAPVGNLSGAPLLNGYATGLENATALNLAADVYRADIAAPTGSGPVRGGGKLNDVLYVFRNNAGGTACDLWKSTASGWVQVTLFHEISFDTGVGTIADGDTITQAVSGATALVRRVVLESGAWEANASGRLVISGITGTFDAVNVLQVGAVTQATSTSLATAITLLPDGTVETVNYNFYGGSASYRMYGCDRVNRAFEFDGTVYVPISARTSGDTPSHVCCHTKHLFLSYDAYFIHSGDGLPYNFTAMAGANGYGMGDDIVGFKSLAGEALAVMGARGSYQLLGTTITDFQLNTIAENVGGDEYTIQTLGSATLMTNLHGVTPIAASDAYGNFAQSSVSNFVKPIIDLIRTVVIGSSVYRNRNQYRIYGSDGSGVIATAGTEKTGLNWTTVYYYTQLQYPIDLNCVIGCDDGTVYICDDAGMVYQADKGTSFDGDEIQAYFGLVFNHHKSPTTIKSYLRAVFEVTANGYSSIRIYPNFSYGDTRYAQHITQYIAIQGDGGLWDVSNWDEFTFDAQQVTAPSFSIRGNGLNVSMIFYSNSEIDQGHKIDGVMLHYIPRRIQR